MGTIFATGLVWFEERVSGAKISALLVIAGTVGPDVFPAVVGQFLEDDPGILITIQFATIIVCILLFIASFVIAKVFKLKAESEIIQDYEPF